MLRAAQDITRSMRMGKTARERGQSTGEAQLHPPSAIRERTTRTDDTDPRTRRNTSTVCKDVVSYVACISFETGSSSNVARTREPRSLGSTRSHWRAEGARTKGGRS